MVPHFCIIFDWFDLCKFYKSTYMRTISHMSYICVFESIDCTWFSIYFFRSRFFCCFVFLLRKQNKYSTVFTSKRSFHIAKKNYLFKENRFWCCRTNWNLPNGKRKINKYLNNQMKNEWYKYKCFVFVLNVCKYCAHAKDKH